MIKVTEDSSVKYASGAVRSSDAEATRYDLISPIGLAAVAAACAEGAARYGDYNWEKGMPANDSKQTARMPAIQGSFFANPLNPSMV